MIIFLPILRIVQAYDNIMAILIQQMNFTNISVVQKDLALRGEKVSVLKLQHLMILMVNDLQMIFVD